MSQHTIDQVSAYIHEAEHYVHQWYGMDESSAEDIVQDVLIRLFRSGPDTLDNPRRYLKRACRWRALQILRGRKRRDAAHAAVERQRNVAEQTAQELLVALEDEDKPKFFERATPKEREVFELLIDGHSQVEVSAILEIPPSTVRMRIHLARKRLGIYVAQEVA